MVGYAVGFIIGRILATLVICGALILVGGALSLGFFGVKKLINK